VVEEACLASPRRGRAPIRSVWITGLGPIAHMGGMYERKYDELVGRIIAS